MVALCADRKRPKTAMQTTGGGGLHIFFQDPGSMRCIKLDDGIDVKADGGYIIASPSVHPSGERYRWAEGRSLADLQPAKAPDWLLSEIALVGKKRSPLAVTDSASWAVGERNTRLTSIAGGLRRQGCGGNEIATALQELNVSRCKPPLPESEVTRIATGMERYQPAEDQEENLTQVKRLLLLGQEAEFFHTPDGEPYATVPVEEHFENWPLKSRRFRQWLLRRYHDATKGAPKNQAVLEAVGIFESKANFEGPERPVFVRVAEKDGSIYLDLANERWEAVEIDANGWRVVSAVPVRFRRARGMSPLPEPVHGGEIDELRRFVNVANQQDWMLLVGWLVASVRPRGPYPILVLHGEQGSAKSTTSRVLRSLVDPNTASLRGEPRDLRDVMIAASNGWVISLDNLSRIPPWLSDALCRLATGGGFSTRELYTDSEEALFDAQRPSILNGIEELATRGDLLDRALILYLPSIPQKKRESETKLWSDFNLARPGFLGALLNVVSAALRRSPSVKLARKPRLADFAVWVTAAERYLEWPVGAFLNAYAQNQSSANALALEASSISDAVQTLARSGEFEGTASELLRALKAHADVEDTSQKSWPANGQVLANKLRRISPNLRANGVDVSFSREPNRNRRRLITIHGCASTSSNASENTQRAAENCNKTRRPEKRLDSVDAADAIIQPLTPQQNMTEEARGRARALLSKWQRRRR